MYGDCDIIIPYVWFEINIIVISDLPWYASRHRMFDSAFRFFVLQQMFLETIKSTLLFVIVRL